MREPDSRSSFGDLLRRYRRQAGFSQEELAQRANVSLAAVSALERGTRRAPQRQTLALLIDGLALGTTERAELLEAALRSRARAGSARVHAADVLASEAKQANFPLYLTSFVGREREIADLEKLITDQRFITIVGAGGIGKTRLACKVASRLTERFARIVFADLAPFSDAAMLVPYLAGLLNASGGDSAPIDAIVSVVGSSRVLLVLDNCERLLEATASTAATLLKQCSQLTIIATSRERLSVSGERIYRLQALDPAPALDLFIRRAESVEPDLTFGEQELADVRDICRRLDGIPLAIELVVARLPTLGITQLRRHLDEQFRSSPGFRDTPQRHQTMYATIAWSFDLLDLRERALMIRAGIFSGGFTSATAEIVCGFDELQRADVIDILSRLVEKSLLFVTHDDATSRYRLLDSVRLFSLEHLASTGEFSVVARRHASWIVERADAANLEAIRSLTDRAIARQMLAEIDNIRIALERLLASHDPADVIAAARIVGGLRTVWIRFFLYEEGARLATEVMSRLNVSEQPELSALVMRLQIQSVPQPPERRLLESAIQIFKRVADYYALSNLYVNTMQAAADAGDFELAEMCYREASRLFESDHALQGAFLARFLSVRSDMLALQGNFFEARAADAAARAILDRDGEPEDNARRCQMRGQIEAYAGNYSEAIRLENEALELMGEESLVLVEDAHSLIATYAFLNGEYEHAASSLRIALAASLSTLATFLVVVHVAAATAARHGDLNVAARLEGFHNRAVTAKKRGFRNALEIELAKRIDEAFARCPGFGERPRFSALGAAMSASEARLLAKAIE